MRTVEGIGERASETPLRGSWMGESAGRRVLAGREPRQVCRKGGAGNFPPVLAAPMRAVWRASCAPA
eukprot:261830-Chlamydomonas_euryale.AAC.3